MIMMDLMHITTSEGSNATLLYSHINISTTNRFSEPSEKSTLWIVIHSLYCIIRHLLSVVGLAGNIVVLLSIMRMYHKKTTAHILMASLAVSDIITNLISPFTLAFKFHGDVVGASIGWHLLCMLKESLSVLWQGTSVYNIFLISLDRFISVTFPIWYMTKVTKKNVKIGVIFVWILVLTQSVLTLPWAFWNEAEICTYPAYLPSWFYYGVILPQFSVCFLLTVLCYIRIAMVSCKRNKKDIFLSGHRNNSNISNEKFQMKESRVSRKVIASPINIEDNLSPGDLSQPVGSTSSTASPTDIKNNTTPGDLSQPAGGISSITLPTDIKDHPSPGDSPQSKSGINTHTPKPHNQLLQMLVIIIGVYFVLYLPAVITSTLKRNTQSLWFDCIYNIALLLFYTNAVVNPFIYAYKNTYMRKEMRKIIHCH